MKLKYYYKIDHNKQPVPGSNVRRKSSPGKQWKEITPVCCGATPVEATGGFRFFVAIDHNNKPIDGSLIKRKGYPEMVREIKYQEIDWRSQCCYENVTWEFQGYTDGTSKILVNGVEKVNVSASATGSILVPVGATIDIVIRNNSLGTPRSIIDITGSHEWFLNQTVRDLTYSFTCTGGAMNILTRTAELAE